MEIKTKNVRLNLFAFLAVMFVVAGCFTDVSAQYRPNPTQQQTDEWRRKGPCRDPWVSMAITQATGGTRYANGYGDYAECDPKWYNNGSWSSYDELYKAVEEAQRSWWQAGYEWKTSFLSNNRVGFYMADRNDRGGVVDGVLLKGVVPGDSNSVLKLVGNDGASLIGNDSG